MEPAFLAAFAIASTLHQADIYIISIDGVSLRGWFELRKGELIRRVYSFGYLVKIYSVKN